VESGIERAVFDLEDIVRAMLDYVGDGVTVGGAADQCFEDEQVEGALEHFPFERVSASDRHRIAEYAPIDDRPGQWLGQHFAQGSALWFQLCPALP
jgi:hypothetical protein